MAEKRIGLKFPRFSSPYDWNPNHENVSDYGKSNTDTTHWRPDISIARAQMGIMSGKKLMYDFPDGKDNGERVQTFIRAPGLDITEVETAQQRITQIIEDKTKSDKKKNLEKAQVDKFTDNIQKLADSVDSSTPQSAPSNPS